MNRLIRARNREKIRTFRDRNRVNRCVFRPPSDFLDFFARFRAYVINPENGPFC